MALPYQPLSPAQRVWLAIAAAALLHLVILQWIAKDAIFHFTGAPKRAAVSLVPWSGGHAVSAAHDRSVDSLANSKSSAKTAAEKKKEEEEKVEQVKVNGQVVSLGVPLDQRAPIVPTKYLSEYDSRVLKETRARETSAFYKNALSKVQKEGKQERVEQSKSQVAPLAEPPAGTSAVAGKEGGGLVKQAPDATPTRARQDRVHIETAADGTVRNRSASDALRGNHKMLAMSTPKSTSQIEGRGEGAPGGVQGAPSGTGQPLKLQLDNPLETLGPIAGGPMPDRLEDVDEGDGTFLNSRAFIGASYLNRVKEAVARIWTPDVQEAQRTHDPTGQTYGYKDRSTLVAYTVDKQGDIVDVKVNKSSGVQFLDDVAINAFKKAERIPNPPAAILGPDGTATFGFMFVLESSNGAPLFRMGPAYMPGSPAARGW